MGQRDEQIRMSRRMYTSGSRFAFWRWTFTPSGYLTRLFLVHTPWGGVMLHWINGPDPEPDMHNHPVTFLSLILRGGYDELREGSEDHGPFWGTWPANKIHSRRWGNFIRARFDVHRIVSVKPGTMTLVFYGPKRCDWSFFTKDGPVGWREYNAKYEAQT